MKRLVVAVDCDDVLLPSTQQIVEMYNKIHNTQVQLENSHVADNPEWQTVSAEATRQRLYDIQLSEEYAKILPFEDAIRSIGRIGRSHELHLVTARPEQVTNVTSAMLDKHFPGIFQSVEHIGSNWGKGEVCRLLGADILIDDNLKHLVDARANGVGLSLWFGEYQWNTGCIVDDMTGIVRCADWNDVEAEVERIAGR